MTRIAAPTLQPMGPLHLDAEEYATFIAGPFVGERVAGQRASPLVIVEGEAPTIADPGSLPVVVGYLGDTLGGSGPAAADLVFAPDHLDMLTERVGANPIAAASLAVHLRGTRHMAVEQGLAAESAVYSALQAGAEFARWRADTTPNLDNEEGPTVLTHRHDTTLTITLNRPHRHNAITRQLRDELCQALTIAIADTSITNIRLTGNGPSFCSGGDLAEFGARPDPATAHVTRLAQSPARLIHQLRHRTTVEIHGATLGGGLEMAAFASTVIADPATRLGLPEVDLGLIPGAGGTVSLTHRIGRQRVAALALATDIIDAPTAHDWGLVDEIRPTG
jgi:enoyl-CoA hydratase/carnithine racemase